VAFVTEAMAMVRVALLDLVVVLQIRDFEAY
jgi:hypothetical protein